MEPTDILKMDGKPPVGPARISIYNGLSGYPAAYRVFIDGREIPTVEAFRIELNPDNGLHYETRHLLLGRPRDGSKEPGGQSEVPDGPSLEHIRGYPVNQFGKAISVALETSNEPAVLEQARLALEAFFRVG